MNVHDAMIQLQAIDVERVEVERMRTNPTMAERAERIAELRSCYAGHVLNDVKVATFKRLIWTRVVFHIWGLIRADSWAAIHSSMNSFGAPRTGIWFRAHEGTYPCVHEGVLIGFCSPEYAAAFEDLAARGRLTVDIDFADVDRHGVPHTVVRRSVR